MKAHIEHDWVRDSARVWLYRGGPQQHVVLQPAADGGFFEVVLNDGEDRPGPTLELQMDALEALAAAASDVLPPSGQMAEHLQDAREVRDRLLSLVEHVVHPIAPEAS